MKECIDFYSRLLIATITFAIPVIIYLLTTFSEKLKKNKEDLDQKRAKFAKDAAESVETDPTGTPLNMQEVIDGATAKNIEALAAYNLEITKLRPIKHFWKLFVPMLLSVILLLIDFVVRDELRPQLYNHNISILLLCLSLLFYFIVIGFITNILYLINDTRKNLN